MNTADTAFSQLPVLVHAKSASFEWSRVALEALRRQAKKQGPELRLLHDWRDACSLPQNSVLVVHGVDEAWLREIFEGLAPLGLRIVLLDGVLRETPPGTSRVLFDQKPLLHRQLELLRSRGRTRTAFFGVQENDTSDASKAEAFMRDLSPDDVYHVSGGLDACFERFLLHVKRYDSVICANDLIAVYLLSRCREHGIVVPEQLHLLGNCDLWIGRHTTPALTTAYYDTDALATAVLQLCRSLATVPSISSMDVFLTAQILERGSTGAAFPAYAAAAHTPVRYEAQLNRETYGFCPSLLRVRVLDQALSACSHTELAILQQLAEGGSYSEIAEALFLSGDTVKYHIKKLYRLLDIHCRQELEETVRRYGLCFR